MDGEKEVIFESWVLKYQGDGRGTFRLGSNWKKRYVIILRHGNEAQILYYEKKPRSLQDTPKGRIVLNTWFTVQKKQQFRGQSNVCEITTATEKLIHLATEEEKLFHLLTFFLQTQVKLKEGFESESFVVRPDGSDDHMRLGSRGSMCLLHVSKGGITLALQLSRCVLTQWPLSCIKFYESTDRGQFSLETGKNAPTGQGKFVFNTRLEDNNRIYDMLDTYVLELAGLKELAMSRTSAQSVTLENLIDQQYTTLQRLVITECDARFLSHLKKVSRGIYDQLAEHLGATSHSHLNVSNHSNTESTNGPPMMTFAPKRSASQQGARPKQLAPKEEFSSMSLDRRPKQSPSKKKSEPIASTALSSSAPVAKIRNKVSIDSSPRVGPGVGDQKVGKDVTDFQYLDMGTSPKKNSSSVDKMYINIEEEPVNTKGPIVYYNSNDSENVSFVAPAAVKRDSSADQKYLPMSGSETSSIRENSFLSDTDITSPRSSVGKGYSDPESPLKAVPDSMNLSSPVKNMTPVRLSTFYQDMGGADYRTWEPRAPINMYRSQPTLNRQLSHSLDDVSTFPEYAQMSGEGVPNEYNLSKPRSHKDQVYSYARPTDLDLQGSGNMIKRVPTAKDKSAHNSRPMPNTLRKSMSLSNLLGAQSVSRSVYERPAMDLPPDANYLAPMNNSSNMSEPGKKASRPANFDFTKVNSSKAPSRRSYESQTSTEQPVTPRSEKLYMAVGNSKFWSVSLDQTPSPSSVTPPTMKGVSMTEHTRIFSRKKSPEKQMSTPLVQQQQQYHHQQQEQQYPIDPEISDFDPDGILRRSDLSSSSMRGRRLPSLPPGAHLQVEGVHVKGTLC